MMMTVYFKDGTKAVLNYMNYYAMVRADRRVVKAVRADGVVLFDRSGN